MKIYSNKEINEKVYKELAGICAAEEGLNPEKISVSLSFVSKAKIKALNKEYRGIDKVTDVLSFPMYEGKIPDVPEIELGDVVICMDKIRAQAKEFGHSEERETQYLFVHSMLHLLGYDHMNEKDKKKMRAQEEKVLALYNLPKLAKEAAKNAYAPFSKFKVGAAVYCKDGSVYTGCNIENSSYGATICAERTAFVKAISEGHMDMEILAVTEWPCGICRQFMYEFNPNLIVLCKGQRKLLKELLPEGFKLENNKEKQDDK